MKTITKKIVVPEEIIEEHEEETMMYGCDCCDFENDDEDVVKEHYAKNHACRETKTIGSDQFVRFETEDDMNIWAESQCVNSFGAGGYYDDIKVKWDGPGWYHIYGKSERCSRGCCTNYILHFETAFSFACDLKYELKRKQEKFAEIIKEFSLEYI